MMLKALTTEVWKPCKADAVIVQVPAGTAAEVVIKAVESQHAGRIQFTTRGKGVTLHVRDRVLFVGSTKEPDYATVNIQKASLDPAKVFTSRRPKITITIHVPVGCEYAII